MVVFGGQRALAGNLADWFLVPALLSDSFIYQLLIEHLLCTRYCSKVWHLAEKNRQDEVPALVELTF